MYINFQNVNVKKGMQVSARETNAAQVQYVIEDDWIQMVPLSAR